MNISDMRMKFNNHVKLNFDGGDLTSDGGLLLVKEYVEQTGYIQTLGKAIQVVDDRKYHTHSNTDLVVQRLFQIIAGYGADSAAKYLVNNPIFSTVLGSHHAPASQSSMSRLYGRLSSPEGLGSLWQFNQERLDQKQEIAPRNEMIVDLDSTYATTYGHQEGAAYNSHYSTVGYHPLVAFDGLTGDCLRAELRPGNVYTSTDAVNFIFDTLKHYRENFPEKRITLRADSGFASPAIYEMCDTFEIPFLIRLKSNQRITSMAEENCVKLSKGTLDYERYVHEADYQAGSWGKSRRVVIESIKQGGELYFRHAFIVTSLDLPAEEVLTLYKNRGTMENFIKEAKNGFYMDKMDSHDFSINSVKMTLSLLAYNLINAMKQLCFPPNEKSSTITTIRTKLIKVASKRVITARYIIFKCATSFVYQKLFRDVFRRIRLLQ